MKYWSKNTKGDLLFLYQLKNPVNGNLFDGYSKFGKIKEEQRMNY